MSRYCSVRLLSLFLMFIGGLSGYHASAQVTYIYEPNKPPKVTTSGAALGIDHSPMATAATFLTQRNSGGGTVSLRSPLVGFSTQELATFGAIEISGKKIEVDRLADPGYVAGMLKDTGRAENLIPEYDEGIFKRVNYNIAREAFKNKSSYAADLLTLLIKIENATDQSHSTFLNAERLRTLVEKATNITENDIKQLKAFFYEHPAEESLTIQSLSTSKSTLWSGELTHSTRFGPDNIPMDISISSIQGSSETGSVGGIGGAFRLAFSDRNSRENEAYLTLESCTDYLAQNWNEKDAQNLKYSYLLKAIVTSYAYLTNFAGTSTHPFVTGVGRYQNFNGFGSLYSLGFDTSLLVPDRKGMVTAAPWANAYRITLQEVWLTSRVQNDPSRTGVRLGVSWFRQDRAPFLKQKGTKDETSMFDPKAGKWTKQFGLSVFFQNPVDRDTIFTATFRTRAHLKGDDHIFDRGSNPVQGIDPPIVTFGLGSGLKSKPYVIGNITLPF